MMKLKIKKANKFYLVENDTTSTDSSVGTSNNDDIFTIKDTDSKFLLNFKEYCKSAVSNAEQPSENNPENVQTPSGNIPSKENQQQISNAAGELENVGGAVQLANIHLAETENK